MGDTPTVGRVRVKALAGRDPTTGKNYVIQIDSNGKLITN